MNRIFFFLSLFLFISCGSEEPLTEQPTVPEWLIPVEEVFDGGPGKDGIPAVDNPQFDETNEVSFLQDEDLVIGMVRNGVAKAYPHLVLDWHEIVNDELDDAHVALTYCPLTGTGVAWDRNINGNVTTFGVSGKLYNTNLMPYDRESDSYWSQMRLDCVNGALVGSKITTLNVIETTWATWKAAYPDSEILNMDTGFDRNYDQYPYGDYRTNNNRLIFPVGNFDNRLPSKERVLGIVEGTTKKVYSINLFEEDRVIEDVIDGKDIIVIGSKSQNFIVALEKEELNGFSFVKDQLPIIAEDDSGNKITMTGEISEGPLAGTKLTPVKSYMGFFFSFGAFHEDVEIYE